MRNLASLIIILLTPLLGNTLQGQQYHKVLQPDGGYIIQLGTGANGSENTILPNNPGSEAPKSGPIPNQKSPSVQPTGFERINQNTSAITELMPSNVAFGIQNTPEIPQIKGFSFIQKSIQLTSAQTTSGNDTLFTEISAVFPGVRTSNAEWGDFDNDGDLDFIIAGTLDQNSDGYGTFLYENQGNHQFLLRDDQDLHTIFQGTWSWTDYDGDGDLDLFGVGLNGEGQLFDKQNFLYENQNGTFVDTGLEFNPLGNSVSEWADMDNDGDLDLVLSGLQFSTRVSGLTIFYINEGNGKFTETIFHEITGVEFGELLIEDFDNDQDNDILLVGGGAFQRNVGLYENLGDLEFSYVFNSRINDSRLRTADAGDIDQDGDLDIVVGGTTETTILENTGNMNFQELTITPNPPEASRGQIRLADLTNDGWVDLFITGYDNSSQFTNIYLNEGNKDFKLMDDQGVVGVNSSAAAFADYDNDGDLDLLLTGSGDDDAVYTKIYRNNISQNNLKPSTPTNITPSIDFDDAAISWCTSIDDITANPSLTYNYYLSSTSGNSDVGPALSDLNTGFRKVAKRGSLGSQTHWQFKDLPQGQYYLAIQAVDDMNKASSFSSEISFTILEKDAPNAPTNLAAISKSSSSVDLSWVDEADDEASYRIERSLTGLSSDFSTIDTQPANTETYTDELSGLLAETTYYYRIVVVGTDGKEALESVSVTTQNSLAPTNFRASQVFPESIIFEWNDETNDELNFLLERSTNQTSNFELVAEISPDETIFRDENISGQHPFYRLGVRMPNNDVLYSSIIEVSIPTYFTIKNLPDIENSSSAGAAWGDFDNDGDPDLQLGTNLYVNQGNGEFNIFSGISLPASNSSALYSTWGDFNNDGWLDLLYLGSNGLELYINDSGQSFEAFDFGTSYNARGMISTDFDNDGFLDILGINFGSKNLILKNIQGVFFQQITEGSLYENSELTWNVAITDVNNDYLPDVFLINWNAPDNLFINQGNFDFLDDTSNDLTGDDKTTMAVSFGHFDNDGYIDAVLTKSRKIQIFKSDAQGDFQLNQEIGNSQDFEPTSLNWADIDNDGDQDILAGRTLRRVTLAWINDGEGNLSHQGFGSSLYDIGVANNVSTTDYDLDGDLDLLVSQYQDGYHVFYENNNSDNNWLKVHLSGFRTNWSAIGARVKIQVNNEWKYNEVFGSNGNGSDDLLVHFGLNKATEIDSLVVRWPSGNTQSLSTVQANQVITIQEADVLSPDAPSCLIANKITNNKIVLTWNDNTINEDKYVLERSIDNATFTSLAQLDPDETQYEDMSLSTSTTYYYRLYAENVLARSDTIYSTQVTFDLGEDLTFCSGESYLLDAGEGFISYLWNDGSTSQTLSVSEAETYSVTVTIANGCTAYDEISVALLDAPVIDLGEDQSICEGASIELDPGDDFDSYLWIEGSTNPTLTVSEAGTFSVTVTNADGCTSYDEISIEVLDVPVIDLGEDQSICEGASIDLNAGDGFDNYLWNDGSTNQILAVSEAGIYSVTVTNANGCTSSDEISIELLDAPVIDLGEDQSTCEGASIELDAGDGFDNYLWNDGSTNQILAVSEAGIYSVMVTNANGCTSSDEISIEVLDVPVIDLGEGQNICEGASIELDAGDGFDNYLWNDGSTNQILAVSEAGIYSVTVTNANGCTSSDEISIEVLDVPVIDLGEDQSICEGASIELDAGDGFDNYLWNDGSTNQILAVSEAGIYSVMVTNANGCTSSDEISIEVLDVPVIDLGEGQNICEGASIELDAGDGFDNYLWNDGSTNQILAVSEAGIYSVTVTNANGCTSSDEISIEVLDVPVIDLGGDQSICEGASIELDAGDGFDNYLWNDGSTNQILAVSEAGIYSVTVTNANGCTSSDEISIEVLDVPVIDLGGDQSICEGASIELDARDGFDSYLWSDGSTNPTLTVSEAGIFSVTVTNANGCASSDEITMSLYDEPVVDLGDDLEITDGNTITLDAGEGFSTYTWSNGMTTQRIEVQESGIYSVIVSSSNECTGTDEINVVFDLTLSVNKQNGKIGIYPNPVVDKLFLENFDNSKRFDIVITSIAGKKVFHQVAYMESFIPFEMDLSGIESGLYFIVIDGKISNKFYKP